MEFRRVLFRSASAMNEEFSRVGGVAQFKRPGGANIAPLVPANAVDMAIRHRFAQRLRDAHEHQQIAVGQAREPRIEGAEHEGFGIEMARERRARKIDIVGTEYQAVDCEIHGVLLSPDPPSDGLRRRAANYAAASPPSRPRSEEHTSELQSLMRHSYAV